MEIEEEFFTLPSNSSKDWHGGNTISAFTTKLARPFILKPGCSYRVGLAELKIPADALPTTASDDCYVYCSICALNYVGDALAPLLRSVRISKVQETYEFAKLYMHKLIDIKEIKDVTITLAAQSGKNFPFKSSSLPSSVVLCIQTIPPTK